MYQCYDSGTSRGFPLQGSHFNLRLAWAPCRMCYRNHLVRNHSPQAQRGPALSQSSLQGRLLEMLPQKGLLPLELPLDTLMGSWMRSLSASPHKVSQKAVWRDTVSALQISG